MKVKKINQSKLVDDLDSTPFRTLLLLGIPKFIDLAGKLIHRNGGLDYAGVRLCETMEWRTRKGGFMLCTF